MRLLIEHFVAKYQTVTPLGRHSVGQDFIDALAQLELPGNVRELENLVLRAMVQKADDEPLGVADLPAEIWQQLYAEDEGPGHVQPRRQEMDALASRSSQEPAADFFHSLFMKMGANGWNLRQSLDYCEQFLIEAALDRTHGNQSQAAQLLGITARSVYNKLRKVHSADS